METKNITERDQRGKRIRIVKESRGSERKEAEQNKKAKK